MPSRQDYENQLREDTRQALTPHFQGLQAELQKLRDSIAASVAQLEQKVAALESVDIPKTGETLRDALEGAARDATQEKESLAQFALEMRRCETQEEILSLLLDGIARYAPCAVLFILRGEQFVGWASRGYSEETAAAIASQPFPESDSPALTKALEAEEMLAITDVSAESRVFALLPEQQQGPWHAFPLRALRRPVAVLLVTGSEGHPCELHPIALMMHITGLCVENVALKILQEMKASSMPGRPEPAVTAPAPAVPEPQPVVSEPAPAEAAPVAEAAPPVEPGQQEPEPAAPAAPPMPPVVEDAPAPVEQPLVAAVAATVETPPVERVVPSIAAEPAAVAPDTAEATAQVAGQPAPEPAAVQPQVEAEPALKPAAPRDAGKLSEEERLHSDAKRFARLLVSEIKLYNEQRVVEGRANRDLYVRLKRDIDRSREMYEKRVSPVVSRKMDYFHDELIRILGENDPVTLGSDYPGSRVEN